MAIQQGLIVRRHSRDFGRELFQLDLGVREPLLIRRFLCEFRLDFGIINDAALLHIDQEHLAWLETPLLDDLMFRNCQDTHFRCHDNMVIIGDQVTSRAQTIPVECRTDLAPIRKGDGSRSIPGFHECGVVFVEGATLIIHQRIAGPGFRNE